ncbi:MAG: MarR family transcriptional regulator [Chloroflexota bacterium]
MITTEEAARETSAFDREELLRGAVKQSFVLGQVMRRAAQQVRSELVADDPSDKPTRTGHDRGVEVGRAQFFVLHILSKAGPLAVGDIAERCHVSGPTISRMLNQLEANGMIERRIDPANRRVIRVDVTEAGRAAEAGMTRRFEAALQSVLSPLTDGELADLITAFCHLERLVADDADDGSRPAPRSTVP